MLGLFHFKQSFALESLQGSTRSSKCMLSMHTCNVPCCSDIEYDCRMKRYSKVAMLKQHSANTSSKDSCTLVQACVLHLQMVCQQCSLLMPRTQNYLIAACASEFQGHLSLSVERWAGPKAADWSISNSSRITEENDGSIRIKT